MVHDAPQADYPDGTLETSLAYETRAESRENANMELI
jgi:hypothetical protein